MAIENLQERASFWGSRKDYNFEGESIAEPFAKHVEIFKDVEVLEIGPGAGRQFRRLGPLAKAYAVADISSEILGKIVYSNAQKYIITSYDTNLDKAFDVVSCWYVWHHVKLAEAAAFIGFARRHLKPEGYFYFNIPGFDHPDAKDNDGIKSTLHDFTTLKTLLVDSGFALVDDEYQNCQSHCVLARLK